MSRSLALVVRVSLVLLAASGPAAAAPPRWTWSRVPQPRTASDSDLAEASGVRVHAIAPAPDGGVFVAGTAWGRVDVAPGFALRSISQSEVHQEHAFLMRLNAAGRTVWVRRLGIRETKDPDRAPPAGATALAVDEDFNLVMAGAFSIEGPRGRVRTATPASLTADGKVSWAASDSKPLALLARLPGFDGSSALSVALAPPGGKARIFVTGCQRSWEGSQVAKGMGDSEVRRDGFVAGFSSLGAPLWVHRFEPRRRPGGLLDDRGPWTCGTSVVVGGEGELFVGGTYFGGSSLAEQAGYPLFGNFLARFATDGRLRWSHALGKPETAVRLAPLPGDRVAVTAAFGRSKGYAAGLVVFDGRGTRQWEVFDTEQPWGVHWTADGFAVGARDDQVLWGGALLRDARVGGVVIERSGACSFVAAFDGAGRPGAVTPLRGGDCRLTAITGGERPWVAGALDTPAGLGAFVHRLALSR